MMDFVKDNATSNFYLSENLRTLRKRLNLSQEELADKIGLNRGNIASYENGTAEPKICNLVKLSNFFGITLVDLTHGNLREENALLQATQRHENNKSPFALPSIDDYVQSAEDYQNALKGLQCMFRLKSNNGSQSIPEVKALQDQYDQLCDLTQHLLQSHLELISYIKGKCNGKG